MPFKQLAPLVLALSATLVAARFGIDHIGQIVRLADPQIAPDGKSIALVVSRTNYEEDRYDPELVLIDSTLGSPPFGSWRSRRPTTGCSRRNWLRASPGQKASGRMACA